MVNSVALVGFADSWKGVNDSKADEVWICNYAFLRELPRIDRMFEIHPLWMFQPKNQKKEAFERVYKHWKFLQEEHPFPIYLQKTSNRIPSGVRYPIEDVLRYIFGNRPPYMTSSFSYMMGLAIYENIKRIELYGFEMKKTNSTDYLYQKPGAEFLIGYAMAKGIDVVIQEESPILKAPLYAYERLQMIIREDLTRHLNHFKIQQDEAIGKANKVRGKYEMMNNLAAKGKVSKSGLANIQMELEQAVGFSYICMGAVQALETLLSEIDMEEPDGILQDKMELIKS